MTAPRRVDPADVTPGWWWAASKGEADQVVEVDGHITRRVLLSGVPGSCLATAFTAFYGPIEPPPAGWDTRGRPKGKGRK